MLPVSSGNDEFEVVFVDVGVEEFGIGEDLGAELGEVELVFNSRAERKL